MDIATLLLAGIAKGSLYALAALALVLIYKTQDVVNFAFGDIFMVGAFSGYISLKILTLPYWLSFVLAVVSIGLLGALIERVAFRRVAHMPHLTLAMVTVGLSFAMKGAARIPFGSDIYTFPPIFPDEPIRMAGVVVAPQGLATIVVAVAVTGAFFLFFRRSSLGKQMRATQQNMTGARLVGVNVNKVFSVTWALSASVGAVAGVLAAPSVLVYPDMGVSFLLKGFAAAVLGGLDSVPGAIVGGFLVGIIEMLVGGLVSTAFQDVSAFFIIMLVLFLKPDGLFGVRAMSRV
jgi:branched-chain amino acid transport system permease protein